jgi:hypothetical protein
MARPLAGEYAPFAENYVALANGNDARQVLEGFR